MNSSAETNQVQPPETTSSGNQNFNTTTLQLPYMKVPVETATDGILAIGEPKARIKDSFLLPILSAALSLRAKWKAEGHPQRTWLIFDFDGDLTPKITSLCQSLNLTDEIAECGAADDTTTTQLSGRIAIFNWTNTNSKVDKTERLTRRLGDAGGTLHNHSKANVATNVLELLLEEKSSPVPGLILSDRLLYPTRATTGQQQTGTGTGNRETGRRWPEPWQVSRQALFCQANCMVFVTSTHIIELPEENADFPFYDLVKTKYIWRCQHLPTSRKVKEWAAALDHQKTLADNATFHLELPRTFQPDNPGEVLELHWEKTTSAGVRESLCTQTNFNQDEPSKVP